MHSVASNRCKKRREDTGIGAYICTDVKQIENSCGPVVSEIGSVCGRGEKYIVFYVVMYLTCGENEVLNIVGKK